MKNLIKKRLLRILNIAIPRVLTSDILLASYPKSGNTWLSFLIANAIIKHRNIDKSVNWFNIGDVIQGIDRNLGLTNFGFQGELDLPRILKTHQRNEGRFERGILLVRDPRDVLTSHFYYTKTYGLHDMPFSDFIRSKEYGITNWVSHTNSWIRNSPGFNIYTVRYEDLKLDTLNELRKITNLFGIQVSDQVLLKTIELSSKENMRMLESTTRSNTIQNRQEYTFVRKGEINQGKDLDESDNDYILKLSGDVMTKLGYLVK